jgi:uncharacterized protein
VVSVENGKAVYDGRPLASWVPDVLDRIFERTAASRVVVYGSVVRGDDGPDSDIDVLVVVPAGTRTRRMAVEVLRELQDLPVPVDVSVIDEDTFEGEAGVPGVVRVARREGRLVDRVG